MEKYDMERSESWKIRTYKTAMLQALREYDMERS